MIDEIKNPLTLTEQFQRGELLNSKCPSRQILKHMTSQWAVLIFIALDQQTLRFSELRKSVGGVSEKMLSQTLHQLELDGFIERKSYPVVPPHVEYKLSPLGQEAHLKIAALADWVETNLYRIASVKSDEQW